LFLLTCALLYWYVPGRTRTLGRTANQMLRRIRAAES
jgi:hypothetical protein